MVWRFRRHEGGQALAEFALALPMLALILFALTELALMLNDQVSVANAARDGARVAALQGNGDPNLTTDVQTAVDDALKPLIPSSLLDSCTSSLSSNTNSGPGDANKIASWTVNVTCPYTPITPLGSLFTLVGSSIGSSFQIIKATTMRDTACFRPSCYP
jgi:Flp pilus assembly protein TadG